MTLSPTTEPNKRTHEPAPCPRHDLSSPTETETETIEARETGTTSATGSTTKIPTTRTQAQTETTNTTTQIDPVVVAVAVALRIAASLTPARLPTTPTPAACTTASITPPTASTLATPHRHPLLQRCLFRRAQPPTLCLSGTLCIPSRRRLVEAGDLQVLLPLHPVRASPPVASDTTKTSTTRVRHPTSTRTGTTQTRTTAVLRP